MPDLFQLPKVIPLKQGAVMPASRLYFYQTATSTPQPVYSDAALTTPITQPVTANSDGVFVPIFLDPNLPNYRVTLTDSVGAVQSGYPVDDYPSLSTAGTGLLSYRVATDSGTANALAITLTNPTPTAYVNGESILVKVLNNTSSTAPTINKNSLGARTITHPDGSALVAGELRANQTIMIAYNSSASRYDLLSSTYAPGISYAGSVVLTATSTKATLNGVDFGVTGNFVATMTGLTTSPTTTLKYKLNNGIATIYATTLTSVGGTSNSTEFGLTGVPAALRPASATHVYCGLCVDNGNAAQCLAIINTDGSIDFQVLKVSGAYIVQDDWTNSGSKSVYTYFSLTYPVA